MVCGSSPAVCAQPAVAASKNGRALVLTNALASRSAPRDPGLDRGVHQLGAGAELLRHLEGARVADHEPRIGWHVLEGGRAADRRPLSHDVPIVAHVHAGSVAADERERHGDRQQPAGVQPRELRDRRVPGPVPLDHAVRDRLRVRSRRGDRLLGGLRRRRRATVAAKPPRTPSAAAFAAPAGARSPAWADLRVARVRPGNRPWPQIQPVIMPRHMSIITTGLVGLRSE